MLRCVNYGVTIIKPGHQTTGNERVIWPDESSFTLFPTSGTVYVWRTQCENIASELQVEVRLWMFVSTWFPEEGREGEHKHSLHFKPG
jgi:hypothetical protein